HDRENETERVGDPPDPGHDEGADECRQAIRRLVGYVNRAAENVLIDRRRRSGREPQTFSLDAASADGSEGGEMPLRDRIADPAGDAGTGMLAHARGAEVRALLDELLLELSDQQAAILRLDLADDSLNDTEIATALGTSVMSVRSQRKKGKA